MLWDKQVSPWHVISDKPNNVMENLQGHHTWPENSTLSQNKYFLIMLSQVYIIVTEVSLIKTLLKSGMKYMLRQRHFDCGTALAAGTQPQREKERQRNSASLRHSDGKINALLDQKENCLLAKSLLFFRDTRVLGRYSRLTFVYEGILTSQLWILCHDPHSKEWKPVYESSQISRIYFLQGNTLLYNLGLYQWVVWKFQTEHIIAKYLCGRHFVDNFMSFWLSCF